MKKRVADVIVETLIEIGVNQCFSVVGGGSMHLNNAFGLNSSMKKIFCHHEQACAFAAEGYAKYSGRMAAVLVTSGPGAVNTLNGVYSAWVDSTPMIVITGHPRSDTTVEACGLKLRCRGVQEFNIIPAVSTMTKYALMLSDPNMVKFEIQKACEIAMDGRRGPVWITVPLDIQAMLVEDEGLVTYEHTLEHTEIEKEVSLVLDDIKCAKRPCILTGSGLRTGDAMDLFLEFISKVQIPIVGGALLSDTLPEDYSRFCGLSGSVGPRAGNYILQNADLILVLANSMSNRQTGFAVERFAPNAKIIMVDAEKDEALKPGLTVSQSIVSDIKIFLKVADRLLTKPILADDEWSEYCKKLYNTLKNVDDIRCKSDERIPARYFWKMFREMLPDNGVVSLGNSNCVIPIFQYGIKHSAQRVITNYNAGSMGYDIPEAIGVAVASNKEVYCVTGDGSIMMNLQELETIDYNAVPIKLVVFSNDGYGAIRQTCKNYFESYFTGCDSSSGVGMPSFRKIADTFNFAYIHCLNCGELENKLKDFLEYDGNVLLEIDQRLDDPVLPKIMSKMKKDGTFETPTLLDMYPTLSDEIQENIRRL